MRFILPSAALLAICSPCAFPQAGLVGTKSPDGAIRFQAVEQFQIAGKSRVRLMPAAATQVTPDDAKRFTRLELTMVGLMRADAAHRVVRLDDAGKPSDIILPDDFAPKALVDAAAAQGHLAIEVFAFKKDKTGVLLTPEQFLVFIPGTEADKLALAFVNRNSAFLNLDEQLAAMAGFAASFPDSPVRPEFRAQLQERLSAGVAAFENHGAFDDLLLTRKFADVARRAFPGDSALGALEDTVGNRIRTVESAQLTLHSLAGAGEWDLFLTAYLPFEPYQWSFPAMMELRQTALEESARLHAHRGALLAERQLHTDALRELTLATLRDPDNRETAKLLETTRVESSLADATKAKPHVLPAGSPADIRFRRSLQYADRAIQDKDYSKAETSVAEAEAENKDAPEILLVKAKLLAARDRNSEAVPLLNAYDRAVSDPAAREAGNAARNNIVYDLDKKRTDLKQQLRSLQQGGDYSKLREVAAQALTLDPDDDDFLYYGGTVAALFRDQAAAKQRLERYLVRSNSLRGDLEARSRAFRVQQLIDAPEPSAPTGTPNWLSGRPLAEGVYYCPVSGAYQLAIDSVAGYKLKMTFQWDGYRLTAIGTTFDDEKGAQNYRALSGSADSQGAFYFGYVGSEAQAQVASIHPFEGPVTAPPLRVTHETSPHLVDAGGRPRILFQNSPQFNPAVLTMLEGPLSVTVAGNSFFNPFIWDSLHYFSVNYDAQGRIAIAREWNTDNLVRFVWSGDRLTEIRAYHKDSASPYYQRTISYSGTMIVGETYSEGSKSGQIKYVYSGKVLQQVKVEDGGVHDGKTWTVRMR